ncbi:MAG: KOW motif-containing protein [Polyangiales bacterium]
MPLSLVIADFEGGERPRKAFRQRAITWAMWVAARFARDGLDFEVHAADPASSVGTEVALHPRAGRGNAGRGRGASLLLSIDRAEVEVCLEVQPVGAAAQTLRAMVDLDQGPRPLDTPSIDALIGALAKLPEQFEARIGAGATETFVSAMDRDMVCALAARLGPAGEPLRIGWRLPREVALEHAALLDEQLADALLALAPLFRLLGGPRAQAPRPTTGTVRLARSGRSSIPELKARATLQPVRPTIDPRERIALAIAAARARTGTAPSLRVSGRTATLARPARIIIPTSIGVAGGLGGTRGRRNDETMIRGTRVRVLAGPFEGKEGVVQELDGKGGARVLLGLLATRLELVDLQPAARGVGAALGRGDRPAFGTSHRRT